MSLLNQEYTNFENERTPTLRQYVKSKKGKSIPKKFMIVKIWVPNKYPSYSIETEHFRASIGKDTPIGVALKNSWSEVTDSEKSMCISVARDGDKVKSLSFSQGSNNGYWRDIGSDQLLGIEWNNA